MARARILEFESDMPSHAVGLSQVRSPAIVMHKARWILGAPVILSHATFRAGDRCSGQSDRHELIRSQALRSALEPGPFFWVWAQRHGSRELGPEGAIGIKARVTCITSLSGSFCL